MNVIQEIERITDAELKSGIYGGLTKGSWHEKYADSAWVYLGGFSYELSEGDLICVMSQWGEIEDINLIRDKATGKSQGFAFIKYEDQRSTILAVDNFNGIKLLGRVLRCDHVDKYKLPKDIKDAEAEKLANNPQEKIAIGPGHAYSGVELQNEHDISKGVDLWNATSTSSSSKVDQGDAVEQIKKSKKDKKDKKHKKDKKDHKSKHKDDHDNDSSDDDHRHHQSSNRKHHDDANNGDKGGRSRSDSRDRDVRRNRSDSRDRGRSHRDRSDSRNRERNRGRDRSRDRDDGDRKRREDDRYSGNNNNKNNSSSSGRRDEVKPTEILVAKATTHRSFGGDASVGAYKGSILPPGEAPLASWRGKRDPTLVAVSSNSFSNINKSSGSSSGGGAAAAVAGDLPQKRGEFAGFGGMNRLR